MREEVLNEVYDLFIDLDAPEDSARLPRDLYQRERRARRPTTRAVSARTCVRCSTPS